MHFEIKSFVCRIYFRVYCIKPIYLVYIWRMYGTYIPNKKFDSTRISVLCDIKKIWKKLPTLKMSRKFILHNNNAEVIKKLQKNNCLINNQVTFPFFISNESIDFSEFIWIFQFFHFYENTVFAQSLVKFLCVTWYLVTKTYRKYVALCSLAKIFKKIFKNVNINLKNSYEFWKIDKFIWKKKDRLIIYRIIFFGVPVENQITTLSVVKIAIKFSPCGMI